LGRALFYFLEADMKNNGHTQRHGRILTGHRPTGPRHLGHLAGTLQTWVSLQDAYECIFLIADLHVLTTDFEHPERIRSNILDVLADWLAAGIDPNRSAIALQSAIPEHAQLSLLFSMLVTVARMTRVPTYKEQQQQLHIKPSLGLLSYPVLQAADILVYKADAVPVGEDQLPHLELAREIARRFNQLYGHTFVEPREILSAAPRLPGIDNRPMHTSYGNTIAIKDSPEETTRKIMNMYTDPTRIHPTDPGHVEGNPVFAYHDIFNPDQAEVAELKTQYQAGKIGDVEVKRRLAAALNVTLAPMRQRRVGFAARPDDLIDILRAGTERARPVAQATYQEVKTAMGLIDLPMLSSQPRMDQSPIVNALYM
jgi:tryptophanyl-tRNA synthetase